MPGVEINYQVEFKPRAIKDLESLPRAVAARILERIERLRHDLSGDVRKLTNYTPEYRLRVGEYRVLFDLDGRRIIYLAHRAPS